MAFWWVTGPVDYAITGFLPIVLNALLQITDMSKVIANYADETIMLLLGASILTVSWELTGLDRRIAAALLSLIGDNLRHQIIFWYLFAAAMSSVLPNAVVVATITPIAVSMLKYVGEGDIGKSEKGSKLLLTLVYAAGVGGLATPLGGAMNLVTVDYLQKVSGKEYMYTSWVLHFLPIVAVIIVSNLLFLLWGVGKKDSLGGSREYFLANYRKMGKMTSEQKWSLALFMMASGLSFTRQFYKSYLPGMKPAYVFMTCAVVSFLLRKPDGKRLLTWKTVQTKVIWEMIYIFAGGLAVGTLINESGAAQDIGDAISKPVRCYIQYRYRSCITANHCLNYKGSRTGSRPIYLYCNHWCEPFFYAADFDQGDSGWLWIVTRLSSALRLEDHNYHDIIDDRGQLSAVKHLAVFPDTGMNEYSRGIFYLLGIEIQ